MVEKCSVTYRCTQVQQHTDTCNPRYTVTYCKARIQSVGESTLLDSPFLILFSVLGMCFTFFAPSNTPPCEQVGGILQAVFNCTAYLYLSNTTIPDIGDSLVANSE